jgi:hypothetical protein
MAELTGDTRRALNDFYAQLLRDQADTEARITVERRALRDGAKAIRQMERLYPWLKVE